MFEKYLEKLKGKIKREIKKKNGIACLNNLLQEKWEIYNNNVTAKLNECFTWNEFYEFFTQATVVCETSYNGTKIELYHDNKGYAIVVDSIYESICFNDLCNIPIIDGKSLKIIWNNLE